MTKIRTTVPVVCGIHGGDCANKEKYLDITTTLHDWGWYIRADGYSDYCSQDGEGEQVLIENRHGVPHVIIWADINDEDPTHIVSLAGAAESERRK